MVQWLTCTSSSGDVGSNPGWEAKVPHTLCMVGSEEEKKMNRVSLTLQRKQLNMFVNSDKI